MALKCSKCQAENPDTQQFCGECGTQLPQSVDITASSNKTLETSREELTAGSTGVQEVTAVKKSLTRLKE